MPYSDPEKQRAAQARSYLKRYGNAEFARKEAERKAAWLQTEEGKRSNQAATERHRRVRKMA